MSVDIYYFSGTGNSLVVARDIVEKTNGKLIAIPSVMNKDKIRTDAEAIGVIFPVHGIFRIPSIVERFVGKRTMPIQSTFLRSPHMEVWLAELSKVFAKWSNLAAANFQQDSQYICR